MIISLKRLKSFLPALASIALLGGLLSSCSESEPEVTGPKQSTLLIYAVATNSLSDNLVYDKKEMLQAASEIDLDENNVLVFQTQYAYDENGTRISDVTLLKLVKNGEAYEWRVMKEFNDGVASLNPARVSEVIDYVTTNYEAESYGLVFWSHSTASQPYFPDDTSNLTPVASNSESSAVSLPMQYSFGQDIPAGKDQPYYQINIDDLAAAIPDHLFEFVWFDSCYMSNIETIYEFRNKCNTFVGYPTEVLDAGLPYHYVLPYMVGKNPNLVHAAELFFDYYYRTFATIAVIDMTHIQELANYCGEIYQPGSSVSGFNLMKYSRYSTGPFYDLGDYTKAMAAATDNPIEDDEWNDVLKKCVIYKATTDGDLLGLKLNAENYSGISTHVYSFADRAEEPDQTEDYYQSLGWFRYTFN